jgi:hypothetical protein
VLHSGVVIEKRGLPNVASAVKKTVKKCNSEKLYVNTKCQNNVAVDNFQSTLIKSISGSQGIRFL